jgi:hypothetical protein
VKNEEHTSRVAGKGDNFRVARHVAAVVLVPLGLANSGDSTPKCSHMKKFFGVLVLGLCLSGFALADASDQGCLSSGGRAAGCGGFDSGRKGRVSMPEPSAIPELLLCVAGLGFVALRLRKTAPAR